MKYIAVIILIGIMCLTIITGCAKEENNTVAADNKTAAITTDSGQTNDKTKNTYTITRVKGDVDWNSIPTLYLDNILWEPDCGIRASAQICYDDSALYVHLSAVEENIRAEYEAPLSPVYEDSCLEFFFMPEGQNRYFNYEINPNECLCLEFGYDRYDRAVLYKEDYKTYFHIQANRTADGWEVYYNVPVEFIRIFYPDYEFSGSLLANVYKCGNKTEHKHYLSWNFVTSEKPDFHRVSDFGRMIFGR